MEPVVHPYTVKRRLAKGWSLEAAMSTPSLGLPHDLSGKRFGHLVVLGQAPHQTFPSGRRFVRWNCQCDCGATHVTTANRLNGGTTRSCGCLAIETTRARATKHGHTAGGRGTREFNAWRAMLDRCRRPKCKEYKWYGARGIAVCERWHTFENFLADMGPCPSGFEIDRRDNDGNYEPDNCRWTDRTTQCNNRRGNVYAEIDGYRLTGIQLARRLKIPSYTIYRRLRAGDTVEQIIARQQPRTHCKNGHPVNDGGKCQTCRQAARQRWEAKQRQGQSSRSHRQE